MLSLKNIAKRIRCSCKAFSETYKFGGFKLANITYLNNGELLANKHILITGGASGIGLAMAKKMLDQGAVVLICGRNEKKLCEAKELLNSNKLFTMVWDIAMIDRYDEFLLEARKVLQDKIDILINNAGVAPHEFFPKVSSDEWSRIYDTNSKGTFFMSQLFAKYWRSKKNDSVKKILNISSQGAFVGATYPYRMTKWDIAGLTQGLGYVLAKDNIIVNGIAPGVVRTAMQESSLDQGDNIYNKSNRLERVALPEEIAELALYLSSDLSNFIVGQTIVIDGGYSLK